MPDPVKITPLGSDWHAGAKATPGAAKLLDRSPGCLDVMVLACPGCGDVSGITVGLGHKPATQGASWQLDGDPADIATWTLSPSLNCVGCCGWHGWLRGGVFAHC